MDKTKQIEELIKSIGKITYHSSVGTGNPITIYKTPKDVAKEIAALYEGWYPREFIWWLVTDTYRLFESPVMFDTKPNYSELVWYSYENDKDYTLPELFQYWQDKVWQPDHVTMHDLKVDDLAREERKY
jgi:hypothetical protein